MLHGQSVGATGAESDADRLESDRRKQRLDPLCECAEYEN
jgi:hypothetical protein